MVGASVLDGTRADKMFQTLFLYYLGGCAEETENKI